MSKFYSSYGKNGLAVYDNYEGVLKSKEFLLAHRCKKHNRYLEAKEYAIEGYNALQIPDDNDAFVDSDIKLSINYVLYRNKIRKMNRKGVD